MRRLRIGVIGTGSFAEVCHVPGLQSHPQAEVVVLCGRRHAHTAAMAERLGIPQVCTDYREVCAREDIDAVTVATPNAMHARQVMAALAAGKHVLCEKPLGVSVSEALEMTHAAEESHKVHQVAFTYRYLYGVRELKRRLMSGDVGEPHYLRLQFDSWQGLHPHSTIGFREIMSLAGGGMLFDVGCHLFDLAQFIFGPIEAVTGFTTLVPRKRLNTFTGELAPVETDDIAGAWFVHENGVRGQWFASRASPGSEDKAYIEVIGQEGALRATLSRGLNDTLRISRPTHPTWEPVALPKEASDGLPHCLSLMMRSFVDACLRGKLDANFDASFHDGLAVQRALAAVSEAAYQSNWRHLKTDTWDSESRRTLFNPYVL
ncbi:MAG TPA: Gfo/Idh/MocA family oxidoreductase [Nitrospiraceae bacterium]|nr:Gfo/Idh/MocA family oxidoreductase [Nitrospiraceae bacterium]